MLELKNNELRAFDAETNIEWVFKNAYITVVDYKQEMIDFQSFGSNYRDSIPGVATMTIQIKAGKCDIIEKGKPTEISFLEMKERIRLLRM